MNDDTKNLTGNVPFAKAREYARPYLGRRSYFADWCIDLMYELRGAVSPFEYAARVHRAEEIVNHVNSEHTQATARILGNVIQNLFPFDKLADLPDSVGNDLVGENPLAQNTDKSTIKPLDDKNVTSKELIKKRYDVLGKSFSIYIEAKILTLQKDLDEEQIESLAPLTAELNEAVEPLVAELSQRRAKLYPDFPPELLACVSDKSIMLMGELTPGDKDATVIDIDNQRGAIDKLINAIRGRARQAMDKVRECAKHVEDRKSHYYSELVLLSRMAESLKSYLESDKYATLHASVKDMKAQVDSKMDLGIYLPGKLKEDYEKKLKMLGNGFFSPPSEIETALREAQEELAEKES